MSFGASVPAVKTNYLVIFRGDSQVYGTASRDIALSTPPPNGFSIEDKQVLFISQQPDTDELVVKPLPKDEIIQAELVEVKSRKKKASDESQD